jgi:hypothetical protein
MGPKFWKALANSNSLVLCTIPMYFMHLNTYTYKRVCTYVFMLISELEGTKHETSKNLPARLFQKQNK